MELEELMRFAKSYVKLGWAVQEQLRDIVEGDLSDINPNALVEISQNVKGYNDELDGLIDNAVAELGVRA